MNKDLVATSKFLSLVLRHKPEAIGLTLDANGWADVDDLVRLANGNGHLLTREMIAHVVATSEKQRFALDESGARIRANQGHSIDVDLQIQSLRPPTILYHGTATRFIESIQQLGLQKRQRHHVHLSQGEDVAYVVGKRHGDPTVLIIRAEEMWRAGHPFYQSENGVWLTEFVPAGFINFPA